MKMLQKNAEIMILGTVLTINESSFPVNYNFNTMVKTVFKIIIFRKILDADPTKIMNMRRKV